MLQLSWKRITLWVTPFSILLITWQPVHSNSYNRRPPLRNLICAGGRTRASQLGYRWSCCCICQQLSIQQNLRLLCGTSWESLLWQQQFIESLFYKELSECLGDVLQRINYLNRKIDVLSDCASDIKTKSLMLQHNKESK